MKTDRPVLWCIEIKANLPTLPAHRQTSMRRTASTSRPKSIEISKGIRDLSIGMAKDAEGVGRELEKLATRDTRPSVSHTNTREEDRGSLDREDTPPRSTDKLREEAGWSKLD